SQAFEGTIKWTMKMEITDPKMKAEMEQAQQKMNDPATQAKMKEFEAQMNDPKMKEMMAANPQMKAQMEKQMAMMKGMQGGGGGMGNMMPSGFTIKIKGGNRLTIMEGGMMAGEMLYSKDKDQTVRLNRNDKTYSILPSGGGGPGGSPVTPKVTKTGETAKILGYNCVKYIVEITEGGRPSTQNIWTTTDIKDFDLKSLAKQRMGQGQSLFYEGMDGVPLKIEAASKEGNIVMEASELKRETLDASLFTIPSDYKEVKMNGRF
ncbi:MAG TPA: DUF4412 domain-containing protein, partial [Cyclobacteriaceae bacterium]|nr:DUF4412 domain-containing protein [Cyclobacteriaceae bacterium]